ncbi:MAG: hypothetical protein AAGB93_00655 [Planctomycetota bacterium]
MTEDALITKILDALRHAGFAFHAVLAGGVDHETGFPVAEIILKAGEPDEDAAYEILCRTLLDAGVLPSGWLAWCVDDAEFAEASSGVPSPRQYSPPALTTVALSRVAARVLVHDFVDDLLFDPFTVLGFAEGCDVDLGFAEDTLERSVAFVFREIVAAECGVRIDGDGEYALAA